MFISLSDLVHATRTLIRARAFTAVCVVSLGLGMGVVIGILVFMRSVLATPPGINEDGLVELVIRPAGQLRAQTGGAILDTWSYPDYLDVRDGVKGMSVSGWSRGEGLFAPDQGAPVSVPTMYVSSNYFSTIGVPMRLGPGFTPADDGSRAEAEAIISHRAWQVRFGGDPAIIGRPITVNQTEYVIVGVAAEEFRGHVGGLDEPYYQLWLPLSRHPRLAGSAGDATTNARLDRDASWVLIVGRLSPGVPLAQADSSVHATMAALAARYPTTHAEKIGGVEPYFVSGARERSQIGVAQMIMLGLCGVVLLVVGLNVSGMMLVRSAIRERELAIRLALGAGRWRLIRYHLSEALALAVLGGILGSAVVFGGPLVVAWVFGLWGLWLNLFRPDALVALQIIALCFVTSLVLGLLPALRFSRPSVVSALKNDTPGTRRVGWLQRLTAAAQAGLAVPFLVIGGLNLDRARVTAMADLGYEPQGLYAARLPLSAITTTEEERRLFVRTVLDNLAQAPGVASVSVGDGIPLDFTYRNTRIAIEGGSAFATVHTTRVGPGYFETLDIPLLAGRAIDANDRDGAERVVVLSEPLAASLFPAGDPLGKRVSFGLAGSEPQTYTVVGVTGDLVSTQMGNQRAQLFVSLAQQPAATVMVIARGTPSNPAMHGAFEQAVTDGLRMIPGQTVKATGPAHANVVFRELITGESLIEGSRLDLLSHSAVGGAAAAVALILAALGVYGVIAFMVATRTREIGVRIALGASRLRVLRDVLGDSLKLVGPGIGVGLVLGVLWVRLLDPSWYPLGGVEPLIYGAAAATAFLVALFAGIPSARRAARVEPMIAMRAE